MRSRSGWPGLGSGSPRRSPLEGRPTWWPRAIDESDKTAGDENGPPPVTVVALHEQLPRAAGRTAVGTHARPSARRREGRRDGRNFRAGEIDVLVCTTVIEAGVDVPNATVMVVMDADRFGISQLHQLLRGRIGRGSSRASACWRLACPRTPRQGASGSGCRHVDGFALADLDLQERREGDVLGTASPGGGAGCSFSRSLTTSTSSWLHVISARRSTRGIRGTRAWRCWPGSSPEPIASNTWTRREAQPPAVAGRRRGGGRDRRSGGGERGRCARPATMTGAPTGAAGCRRAGRHPRRAQSCAETIIGEPHSATPGTTTQRPVATTDATPATTSWPATSWT